MRKILVYLAHPRLDSSSVNSRLADIASRNEAVTVVDLYAEYPNFYIDVEKEQNRLRAHDAIVFQHPVYWYSSPAIMKEWQDLVLTFGFAYGDETSELEGKAFGQVVSAGSHLQDYTKRGIKGATLEMLFSPFRATARHCQMIYLPPLVLYSSETAEADGRIDEFATAYQSYLDALANGKDDFRTLRQGDDFLSTIRQFVGI